MSPSHPSTKNLQYAQIVDLAFHRKFKQNGLISWPHVNVNSLKRVLASTGS